MGRVMPPPAERFDPVTARWFTPGGPLHDPERGDLGRSGDEPVRLLAPVPPELAEADGQGSLAHPGSTRWHARGRVRWVTLTLLVLGLVGLVLTGIGAGV